MFDTYKPPVETRIEKQRRSLIERLEIDRLRSLDIFDDAARTLAAEAETSSAQVNLMGGEHHLVLGSTDLDVDVMPRRDSLCNYPVADGEAFIVEDALEHPRLQDHPNVVGKPHIRFYVGIPLAIDDTPVGSVCAVDTEAANLEWTSRSAVFRMVGLLERLLKAHLMEDSNRETAFELLKHLTSAEARVIRLECSGAFGSDCREDVRGLRDALYGAEEIARAELERGASESLADAPTAPEVDA